MRVPLADLPTQYQGLKQEIDQAIQGVLEKGQFILGEELRQLEQKIAQYSSARYAVGVASGTDALILALQALDIGRGDEVITTPFTFIATAEAISRVGATPVFIDIDPRTYNLDAEKLAEYLRLRRSKGYKSYKSSKGSKVKAIIPVHLYGNPCDMDRILAVAKEYDLKVIEDAAQAIGATYKGRPIGSIGDVGCFSFFPSKNLGAFGDGGMLVTNDQAISDKVRILRVHGEASDKKYHHYPLVGTNSRLDNLQAAVLLVKLKKLELWIACRREIAQLYQAALKDIVVTPASESWAGHVYNLYVIRVGARRDQLNDFLQTKAIEVRVYYPRPVYLQDCYHNLGYQEGDFPQTEAACRESLALPIYPELTVEQIAYVIDSVQEFFDK